MDNNLSCTIKSFEWRHPNTIRFFNQSPLLPAMVTLRFRLATMHIKKILFLKWLPGLLLKSKNVFTHQYLYVQF